MAQAPGVEMLTSGTVKKPIVRGQSGPRVLLLVDGVRHEGQDWGLDHGPEIDPFTADTIEGGRGAAGVRYGAEAMAGVVLVEPRPFREVKGYDGEITAVAELNGRRTTLAARLDGATSSNFAWRIEGNVRLKVGQ